MRNGTALWLALGAVLAIASGFAAAPAGDARADVIIPDPPKSKRVPVETELDWGVLADRLSRAYVVAKGDTLGLVEVMKLFNSVNAPCAGTVTHVLAGDAAVVAEGQPLVAIRPA